MNLSELPIILANGEDSLHQFKQNVTNAASLAAELVAFANVQGGTLIIGVEDDGTVAGLTSEDIRRINQLIANVSTNNINPPLNVLTRNTQLNGNTIMIVEVPVGPNRPYCDNLGVFWVRSGADKRRITSQQELRRIFQREGDLFGDEQPISHATLVDLHHPTLEAYVERIFGQPLDKLGVPTEQLLRNLKLYTHDNLNLTGLLMLAKNPQQFRPQFNVKAVAYFGNKLTGTEYRDRQDIDGRIPELYEGTMSFLLRNLRRVQAGQGFNSEGKLEIPRAALEEVVQNALVHRDYFISAPVRVMLFDDRLEVISPGTLPNSLTVENIKTGAAIQRNPTLASRAFRVLPYNGLGSGIPRAVELVPDIQFDNQRESNQFVVTIYRPVIG